MNPTAAPLVDFLGIGAQRSGTTWLYECLYEHPEIATPSISRKELNFFSQHHELGYDWYHSNFTAFDRAMAGEFSPSYLPDEQAPERVRTYNPGMRLVVSLRHPVERALSQHLLEVQRGRVPPEHHDFFEAAKHNPSYLDQGLYATHLERWLQHFDFGQLHVVLFDDILATPDRVLGELYAFLGVDTRFRPRSMEQRNASRVYRSRRLHGVVHRLGHTARRSLGERGFQLLRRTGLPRLVHRINDVPVSGAVVRPLTPEERASLTRHFAEEVERLGRLIGRDLSSWQKAAGSTA